MFCEQRGGAEQICLFPAPAADGNYEGRTRAMERVNLVHDSGQATPSPDQLTIGADTWASTDQIAATPSKTEAAAPGGFWSDWGDYAQPGVSRQESAVDEGRIRYGLCVRALGDVGIDNA